MKLGIVDYVRDPIPHDNFAAGSATWVVWANMQLYLSVSFLFLSSLFCFLQHEPRLHLLTDRHDLYAKTRVSGQGCTFWGSRQYPTTLRVQTPKNLPKWPGIGILQPNQRSSKWLYIGH